LVDVCEAEDVAVASWRRLKEPRSGKRTRRWWWKRREVEVAADEVRTGPVNDSSLGFDSCRLGIYLATPSGIHPASAETITTRSVSKRTVAMVSVATSIRKELAACFLG